MMKRTTLLALIVFCSGACAESAEDHAATGASQLQPFKAELKAALVAGMKQGPAMAIEVCKTRAPEIAGRLSIGGVEMGRSSHRLRNPDNQGPGWVGPLVTRYAEGEGGTEPVTVMLDDGRVGYAEPIMMQPLCLTCHGTTLADDVAEQLSAMYPEDQATGFSEGDFRGVFWVEFPAD